MKRINIEESNLLDIEEAMELPETKPRFRRKLLAIKMVAMHAPRRLILDTLDITAPILNSYVDEYSEGGLAALLEDRSYRPSSCLEERLEELSELFRAQLPDCSRPPEASSPSVSAWSCPSRRPEGCSGGSE